MILGACYLLWMVRKVIFGPIQEPIPPAGDGAAPAGDASPHGTVPPVGWHEIAGLAPLMVLIVAIGVYPRPFLEQMRSATAQIDENVQAQRAEARTIAATPPLKSPPMRLRGGGGGGGGGGGTAKSEGQSSAKGKGATSKGAQPAANKKQSQQTGPSSPDTKPREQPP